MSREVLIIGDRYRNLLNYPLDKFGFSVYWLHDNPNLDPRLAGHADLSVFCAGGEAVISREYFSASGLIGEDGIVNYLTDLGMTPKPSESPRSPGYPQDAGLCACAVGGRLIHNAKITDRAVLSGFAGDVISVRQGYAKCCTCVVDDDSIITSDAGIAAAAEKHGISVLNISPGNVALPGYKEGFIGGASITLSDRILFTGDLSAHPDAARIRAFIAERGKAVVCLTDSILLDTGGAVVLDR